MGESLCLQPRINLTGNTAVAVQHQEDWLDVSGYSDVALYVDVPYWTGGSTILRIQTSPTRDDALFPAHVSQDAVAKYDLASITLGVQPIQIVRWRDAVIAGAPVSRFMRWTVTFTSTATAEFRIWLNLNRAGW